MRRSVLFIATLFVLFSATAAEKSYKLISIDGRIEVTICVGKKLSYTIDYDHKRVLEPSDIALYLEDGVVLGQQCRLSKVSRGAVNSFIEAKFYHRNTISERYNSIKLDFKGSYGVEFRAYDEGVCYRFITNRSGDFMVNDECAEFNFGSDYKCWIAYNNLTGTKKDPYFTSFENTYNYIPLSEVDGGRLAFSPVVVDVQGVKVCIAESDVEDYPGMFLHNTDKGMHLKGCFAPVPDLVEVGGHNKLQGIVRSRHDYIAKCSGKRTFPWRIVLVTDTDSDLAASDMVYRLASPCRVEDTEWIAPGKVAWEWWNHWGLAGVDFEAGINTATYKAYIDFAADYGIEYVILDEGWAVKYQNDLMAVVEQIDLKEIVNYAALKGVGIILWAGYNAFNSNMEEVCRHYSAMGVKGFKIDFMDRDDTLMNSFHYRAAEICAKYKLMVDFHGCHKPTGLNRTYPNVVNFEGVFGLEQMKWSKESVDQMRYDVTMPFIRMVAGPIDYTQGAMRNAIRKNYRPVRSEPMSQGTRCHQLAAYAIFFSPLSMLCDSPTAYRKEHECAEFIASVPTVWDDTVVLDGKIGEYVITARKSADVWCVGGMTNWDSRSVDVDLSKIVGEGVWRVELFRDGANAHRIASDYTKENFVLSPQCVVPIKMAPGGGFIMRIFKQE
ncbi:MAG: glycoside hydrolase family 97 protein [Alistipes sp.]|nr:glycoside hydrolase family 97 protein [Alistipes sp.]